MVSDGARQYAHYNRVVRKDIVHARSTLADARRTIDDLRSGEIPTVNLETAMCEEADRFEAACGIPCELSVVLPPPLPDEVRENALRVVGEALANIARHARAQQAAMSLCPTITRRRSKSKCVTMAWRKSRPRLRWRPSEACCRGICE